MSAPLFFLGSLPYLSVDEAIAFVKSHSAHLPFLPQLPDLNPNEDMIGQVLRGIEIGGWDRQASVCLEAFQNTFCEAPHFKIQVAGPFTVSRITSVPFSQIVPQWVRFVRELVTQLRQGAFRGELWLQVDEPSWGGTVPLPSDYVSQIEPIFTLAGVTVGFHSCATARPRPTPELLAKARFYAFDFSRAVMLPEEKSFWQGLLEKKTHQLVWGGVTQGDPHARPSDLSGPGLWLSAPCGLAYWKPEEIVTVFGKASY